MLPKQLNHSDSGHWSMWPACRMKKLLENAYLMAASGQLLVMKRSEVEIRNETHAH